MGDTGNNIPLQFKWVGPLVRRGPQMWQLYYYLWSHYIPTASAILPNCLKPQPLLGCIHLLQQLKIYGCLPCYLTTFPISWYNNIMIQFQISNYFWLTICSYEIPKMYYVIYARPFYHIWYTSQVPQLPWMSVASGLGNLTKSIPTTHIPTPNIVGKSVFASGSLFFEAQFS